MWLHLVDDRAAGVGGAVAGVDERRRGEHGRRDPLRDGRCELDREHGAGVVADDRGPLDPERVQEARRDLGPALDRVVPERRLRGVAEADRVHRDCAEALAEEREDVPVLVPGARRLVEEEHRRAGAGDRAVDLAGRHRHEPSLDGDAHVRVPCQGNPGRRSALVEAGRLTSTL